VPKIHVLSERVANRIAAGEVVDRPASVVKELLENALDAGATTIDVIADAGGRDRIRVTDDGCGMEPDDARLAFERHATSKIRDASDIDEVTTFGFRGEALPSIASVAEVEMLTSAGGDGGLRIVVRSGDRPTETGARRSRGTTITVRNLFFNTPARRKFLKSDTTEERHLRRVVIAHALGRQDVAFRYERDGEEIFHLPAGEDLPLRIRRLFGAPFAENLVAVEGREMEPRVSGYVSTIDGARANRTYQYFHVNGRPVQQTLLVQAASAPFRDLLPPRRYPALFLSIEIGAEFVDVNIHPTKREVRFAPERTIFAAVEGAVRRAIRSESSLPPFWMGRGEASGGERAAAPGPAETITLPLGKESAWSYHPPAGEAGAPESIDTEGGWLERIDLGRVQQVGGTYLVAAAPEGLVVVDQHTAHERILFEEILRKMEKREGESQSLLFPETVGVDPELVTAAEEQGDLIEASGFLLRPAGPRSILIEGVPAGLRRRDPSRLVVDFLEYLVHEGKKEQTRERRIAASIACHGAIRAGDALTPEERKGLLLRLAECDQPLRCPHGRPTFLAITANELGRRFLRT